MPRATSAFLIHVIVVACQRSDVKLTSINSYEYAASVMGACTLVPRALGNPTTVTSFTSRAARKTTSETIVSHNSIQYSVQQQQGAKP